MQDEVQWGSGMQSRILIDATVDWETHPVRPEWGNSRKPMSCTQSPQAVVDSVTRRWGEYGLPASGELSRRDRSAATAAAWVGTGGSGGPEGPPLQCRPTDQLSSLILPERTSLPKPSRSILMAVANSLELEPRT